jgi:hypothetical protein
MSVKEMTHSGYNNQFGARVDGLYPRNHYFGRNNIIGIALHNEPGHLWGHIQFTAQKVDRWRNANQ